MLVAIGVKADGHKVVLAVSSGYRESTASWSGLLRELKARGMNEPRLVVGDGNLGLWSALRNAFPGAAEQRCWNHRLVNLLTQVPKQRHGEARELLTKIPYQSSERQARQKKRVFQNWCVGHGYERAAELIENWEQMVTSYWFPRGHWRHLRTTNVVESPFAALQLRTDAAKRFKKVANATAVVWKMLLVAGRKFRRLNSPELLPAVAAHSSITTAYRSEEANTRRPPSDLLAHLLTESPASRRVTSNNRSASRSSSTPLSDVSRLPSNAPTTERRPKPSNTSCPSARSLPPGPAHDRQTASFLPLHPLQPLTENCCLPPSTDDSRVMLCDNAPMATVRTFNTEGPVEAADHYHIPPLERIDLDVVLGLIRDKKYFVLHAPRQTGKTSALLVLRDLLNGGAQGDFRCVYANVEAGQAMRENVAEGMRTVLSQFALRASLTLGDDRLERICREALNSAGPGGALSVTLSRWAAADRKPLVLLIDEIDALVGDTLLSVLRQLRSGYDQRPGAFPHSIILCGVRDVRDYRIHSSDGADHQGPEADTVRAPDDPGGITRSRICST